MSIRLSSRSRLCQYSIWVFVVALAYRLGWLILTDQIHQFPLKEMVRTGIAFAHTGEIADPFLVPTGPTAHVPPAYPIFLGLIFRVFGTGVGAEIVKCLLTSSVSAFRCALMPSLALRLGLSLRTGLIAGYISAFYLGALATDVKGDWAEAYGATALVGLFFVVIQIAKDSRLLLRQAAVVGFWWGLCLLMMPNFIVILMGFILVGSFRFLRESPGRYLQWVSVLVLVAAIVVSPWPVRNAIRLGSPIWSKDNLGMMMLISNRPGASWSIYGNDDYVERTIPTRSVGESLKLKQMGEVAYNDAKMAESLQWIRSDPKEFTRLTAVRLFRFWFPLGRNLIHTAVECVLTLTAFIGLFALYSRNRTAALLISSIWLMYPPLYYIMEWSSRYRYPINWTLILTAAVAISQATSRVSNGRSNMAGGALD